MLELDVWSFTSAVAPIAVIPFGRRPSLRSAVENRSSLRGNVR